MPDGIEEKWDKIKKVYTESASEILGYKTRKSKEWISGESWTKVEERRKLKSKLEGARSERE